MNDAMITMNTTAIDRRNAALLHIGTIVAAFLSGGLLVPVLVPLVALFIWGNDSEFVRRHIVTQLNFQITLAAVVIVGVVVSIFTLGLGALVAVPAILVLLLVDVIASIKAALAAQRGETYEMPFTIPVIR